MADRQDDTEPGQGWRGEDPDNDHTDRQARDRSEQDAGGVRVVVRRCAGCGDWVRYERVSGFDRAMRRVGMFQARCATCGWQHTTLTQPTEQDR